MRRPAVRCPQNRHTIAQPAPAPFFCNPCGLPCIRAAGPFPKQGEKKLRQIPGGAVSMDLEPPAESAAGVEPTRKDYAFDGHGGGG